MNARTNYVDPKLHTLPRESSPLHQLTEFLSRHQLDVQLVLAAILLYAGVDLWQNLSWPIFFSDDETLEIDYVYRLSMGQLPEFFDGQQYNPLALAPDQLIEVQWRYQHPPMFYLLELPIFVLFDATHNPYGAIWAMRCFMFVLGTTLIIVSRWAARWIFGSNNTLVSLVPLFVAANRVLGSVVFNYTLATLWVTLLIGMGAKLIRSMHSSISRSLIVAWAVIVLLAPLTRLSTVPVAGLCVLMVAIAVVVNHRATLRRCLTLVVLPLLLAVVSGAWFYIRLYRLSGHFTGTQPEWQFEHFGRAIHVPFFDVFFDPLFWKYSFSQYQNQSTVSNSDFAWWFLLMLIFIPFALAMTALVRRARADTYRQLPAHLHKADLLIVLLLVGTLAGTIVQQVLFVKQGGRINSVYFSLINIVFAVFVAAGFLHCKGTVRVALVSLWLSTRLAASLLEAHMAWPDTMAPGSPGEVWVYVSLMAIIIAVVWAAAVHGSCRDIQFSYLSYTDDD